MTRTRRGRAAALAAGALGGCAGAGAATTTGSAEQGGGGSSGSRAHLHDSLQEMADAADLVLTGTAGAQQVLADVPGSTLPFTITDLAVDDVLRTGDTPTDTTAAGSTVVVRQTTTPSGWSSSQPDAALEQGQHYLLFLVHSGLAGQAATHYHPIGAVAGIYHDQAGAFTRAVPDSGDDLPMTVTAEQVRT